MQRFNSVSTAIYKRHSMTKDTPKTYVDELAEWVRAREKTRPRQDKHVVAFLAVRVDIEAAIDAGYSLKTIWEHQHDRGVIPYRYETFLRHVKRYIKPKPAAHIGSGPPASVPVSSAGQAQSAGPERSSQVDVRGQVDTPAPRPATPSAPVPFVFNPTPNREDLI